MIGSALFPAKPLPATIAFGILPKFDLNFGYRPTGNILYNLQTVSGDLPNFPTTAKVFAISQNKASFSAPETIKQKANNLDFNIEPEIVGSKMTFTDQNGRTLTADVITGDMELTTVYLNNPDILTTRPDSVERAKEIAQTFLSTVGLNTLNYPEDKVEVKYYRMEGGNLTETSSLSSSNLIKVNYVMGDLDKMPVYSVGADNNSVYALVSGRNVVEAKYQPLNVNKGLFATYPLKSVTGAYEELKSGNAVFNKQLEGNAFTVSSVSLGYVAVSGTSYLIPVYVFDMGNGLLAFVPAVDNNWIQR